MASRKKSLSSLVIVAALSLTSIVVTAAPAAAATCSMRVPLPVRITIDRPEVIRAVSMVTDCTVFSAGVSLYGPTGALDYMAFSEFVKTGVLNVYGREVIPGRYSTVAEVFVPLDTVSFTNTSTEIKFGTRVGVGSSRSGGIVTVNGLVKRYVASPSGWSAAIGRTVYLQRYINGAWQAMTKATTNSQGRVSFRVGSTVARPYRLLVKSTPSFAEVYSVNTTR